MESGDEVLSTEVRQASSLPVSSDSLEMNCGEENLSPAVNQTSSPPVAIPVAPLLFDVEYSWLPTPCERCGQIGHRQKRCLSTIAGQKPATAGNGSKIAGVAHVFASDVPMSDKESKTVPSDVPSTSQAHDEQMTAPKKSSHKDDTPKPFDQVTVFNPILEVSDELSLVEKVGYTVASDLASLATITEIENMFLPPTSVCVNQKIDSPPVEIAPSEIEQTATLVPKESSRNGEFDLGANKFTFLVSSDGEDEDQLEQECDHSVDLMTPYGKRLLQERPVRPSVKAMEWQVPSTSRGRGNRGRGNRGRHK